MKISFQNFFYVIATIFAIVAVLILARTILIPLSIALLISLILLPLVQRFEKWKINSTISVFLALITVLIIILGIITLFSAQAVKLVSDFTSFQDSLITAFVDFTVYINEHVPIIKDMSRDDMLSKLTSWLASSIGALASKSMSETTSFITGLVTTVIFTFLFLIYRKALTIGLVSFASIENRDQVMKMFRKLKDVGQKYSGGVFIVVLIVGGVNSLGLWLIGLDNPIFFGFLAAVFSIVPYVGTMIGTIIPAVYALVSYDTIWVAVGVVVLFWIVQMVTDNLLTPKIVGNSLDVNALTSILSIIIGASVWGVAGMILFLPFVAMLKVFCEEFDQLKPIALLIGTKNFTDKGEEIEELPMKERVDKLKEQVAQIISSMKGKNKDKKEKED